MLDVDILKIDWDEDGCYLILSAEDDTLRVHLTDPEQAYDAIKSGIGPWLYERDMAKSVGSFGSGGYELDDPKHPDFHSIHADIHDSREGK